MEVNQIYNCDAFIGFKQLPDNFCNLICTSPPYFSQRENLEIDDPNKKFEIGLEKSPYEYIDKLVNIFREGRRVLKEDGVFFLNIGDSYCNYKNKGKEKIRYQTIHGKSRKEPSSVAPNRNGSFLQTLGFKDKDLMGIPWLTALALRDDGWWLRQTIIWHKPSCTPESMKDRCTNNFEYIFLLTKNKNYYFDYKAIEEEGVWPAGTRAAKGSQERLNKKGVNAVSTEYKTYSGRRRKRAVWSVNPSKEKICAKHTSVFPRKLVEPMVLAGCPENGIVIDPFMGLSTVAVVCQELNRNWMGFELNKDYIEIGCKRIKKTKKELENAQ